jgi:hypothetical protein
MFALIAIPLEASRVVKAPVLSHEAVRAASDLRRRTQSGREKGWAGKW